MRDLAIWIVVLGSLPITLVKPFFGVLVWTWLSLMFPQQLAFSFAYGQPFAQMVGAAILVALLLAPEERKFPPMSGIIVMLLVFWAWMLLTTVFALNQENSLELFLRNSKILLLVFVSAALLSSRVRIVSLVWVMALSIGFYGVKGGIFTVVSGGGERVWGPAGTFIGGNNEVGLALNMILPLLRYLQMHAEVRWVRLGLAAAMGLSVAAILGTQSRGALLGLSVTGLWLIVKSNHRLPMLAVVGVIAIAAAAFMPKTWHERMESIESYETDASAQGRINAWWAAWYLAQDNLLGAGTGALRTPAIMKAYAPNPNDYHDAHSIYFQVLADHGFIGLGLYLMLAVTALGTLHSISARTRGDPRLRWMTDLAAMINVSLVSFATSGAFLGLAYFDLMLTELSLIVGMQLVLQRYKADGVPIVAGASLEDAGGKGRLGGLRGFVFARRVAGWFRAL